jgi:hypothetical protein
MVDLGDASNNKFLMSITLIENSKIKFLVVVLVLMYRPAKVPVLLRRKGTSSCTINPVAIFSIFVFYKKI